MLDPEREPGGGIKESIYRSELTEFEPPRRTVHSNASAALAAEQFRMAYLLVDTARSGDSREGVDHQRGSNYGAVLHFRGSAATRAERGLLRGFVTGGLAP